MTPWPRTARARTRIRKGGWCGWKPSSSSDLSIRVVRAYPLFEVRQTVPCRAIRGSSISVDSAPPPHLTRARCGEAPFRACRSPTPSLPTNMMDFRGLDSSIILNLMGGIIMSIGNLSESLSQAMFVGIILVGRLGVVHGGSSDFFHSPQASTWIQSTTVSASFQFRTHKFPSQFDSKFRAQRSSFQLAGQVSEPSFELGPSPSTSVLSASRT